MHPLGTMAWLLYVLLVLLSLRSAGVYATYPLAGYAWTTTRPFCIPFVGHLSHCDENRYGWYEPPILRLVPGWPGPHENFFSPLNRMIAIIFKADRQFALVDKGLARIGWLIAIIGNFLKNFEKKG